MRRPGLSPPIGRPPGGNETSARKPLADGNRRASDRYGPVLGLPRAYSRYQQVLPHRGLAEQASGFPSQGRSPVRKIYRWAVLVLDDCESAPETIACWLAPPSPPRPESHNGLRHARIRAIAAGFRSLRPRGRRALRGKACSPAPMHPASSPQWNGDDPGDRAGGARTSPGPARLTLMSRRISRMVRWRARPARRPPSTATAECGCGPPAP
jgi:hypothetical protein